MIQRHIVIDGRKRHLSGWHRGNKIAGRVEAETPQVDTLPLNYVGVIQDVDALTVKDQMDTGDCVYNAGPSGLEHAWFRRTGERIVCSAKAPYAFGRELNGIPLTEDSGSDSHTMVRVGSSIGFNLRGEWDDNDEPFDVLPPDSVRAGAAAHRIELAVWLPNLLTLEHSISQGWGAPFGFQCPENLDSEEAARTGVVHWAPNEKIIGGHEVFAVGVDRVKRQVKFLNSWGDGWGDSGFGYLSYDFFLNYYADDAVSIRDVVLVQP
jgi:hypothetical protein